MYSLIPVLFRLDVKAESGVVVPDLGFLPNEIFLDINDCPVFLIRLFTLVIPTIQRASI